MAKPAEASNNFNSDLVQRIVGRVEGKLADLDSERGAYMQRCQTIRKSIAGIYEEAEAQGLPKRELKAFVQARVTQEKARKIIDDLEQEQRETVEMLAEAFGEAADLPLFAAKIKRTAAKSEAVTASKPDGVHPLTH